MSIWTVAGELIQSCDVLKRHCLLSAFHQPVSQSR